MPLTDILAQMGGLKAIARDLGVSESQAAAGGSLRMMGKPRSP